MAEYENLQLTVEDGIAVLTVNRPEKLNALNAATIGELGDAVARLRDLDEIRGVIVTGSGQKAFVAGADIAELAEMAPLQAVEVSRRGQRVLRELELLRKPVLAAVNGFALGGGCELALACHLRIASGNASFALPEVKLGIIPGYGGTLRLPRVVGRGRALELILTGEMIDAVEAHRIGLVNRLVPQESLLEEARALLQTVLRNGPLALGFAIESVTRGVEMDLDDAQALESQLFGLLAASDDMREGMKAFLEKRPPDFEGH